MALPLINNDNPVTIPASDEIVYDTFAIPAINITRTDDGKISVAFQYCPMNGISGDLLKSASKRFKIQDVEQIATQRALDSKPALAQAMGAILVAADELIHENEQA